MDIVSGEHGALIGSGALRHFAVTLDPATGRARLERKSREPITWPAVIHPGFWIEKRKDGWVVSRVDPEAPAARAGIAAGVEILGLPRVDAGDLSQRRLEEEARAAPEGKLLVHIRREGQTMLVRVPVQVLVE